MQIVIDIDDNLYTRLFDSGGDYVMDMRRACAAIRKGTPLPKSHGRLIDADYMIKQLLNLPKDELSTEDTWAMKVLDLAPTIIEAESEM